MSVVMWPLIAALLLIYQPNLGHSFNVTNSPIKRTKNPALKIIVFEAAPFAYYGENGILTGSDIRLIEMLTREIGAELIVNVRKSDKLNLNSALVELRTR